MFAGDIGDIGDIGFSLRQRQGFRRSMEAATINPRDGSAHYQLGLIYQNRRQYAEAISHFQQAVQIDNEETGAHFQLGRIAREQGRLQEAINHFGVVLGQDDRHAQSEVWREVGATYLGANMFAEAKDALESFIERRAYVSGRSLTTARHSSTLESMNRQWKLSTAVSKL